MATRTITLTVPATWYVGTSHGTEWIYEYQPDTLDRPRPVLPGDGLDVGAVRDALMAALPQMQWAVLSPAGDEVHRVTSEAQAAVLAAVWSVDEPDSAVIVHRLDDNQDWSDECGLTYAHGPDDGLPDDLMDSLAGAGEWLRQAAALARRAPEQGWALDALRREAQAHGHDLTALEG